MLHGGNHTCRDHPFTFAVSHKNTTVVTKISNLVSSDQRTDFHRSNVHCSCFLAQASLFFFLVSFTRGFFAAIRPWRPNSRSLLWRVDVEMCLFLELCEAFTWAAIWGAVNWWFMRLVTRMLLSSAVEVPLGLPFLWRSSWEPVSSQHLMVFVTALEETFKFLEIFQIDGPSCLKVMMDFHFS